MPEPPDWLKSLADAVALKMQAADVLAPIGCHFCRVDDLWEIALFAASTEVVGGEQDGLLRFSRFQVDIRAVAELFTVVDEVTWQALPIGGDDELGAHVAVQGWCGEHHVCLRI